MGKRKEGKIVNGTKKGTVAGETGKRGHETGNKVVNKTVQGNKQRTK